MKPPHLDSVNRDKEVPFSVKELIPMKIYTKHFARK